MPRRTPYLWWGAVTAFLAGLTALVVMAGLALARLEPTGEWGGNESVAEPAPAPPMVLPVADGDPPVPTAAGVRKLVDSQLRATGLDDWVSMEVVDLVTQESLYRRRADARTVPASTIKLLTSTAVLAARGPTHRLATRAVAGTRPGEVVLVGGGDPTLAIDDKGSYPGAARLDLLAEQVAAARGDDPVTVVTVDSSLFTGPEHGPWQDSIPDSGYVGPITALMTDGGRVDPAQVETPAPRWSEPDLAAGQAFAELLEADPETVTRGKAPSAGVELGRVESPTIMRLVEITLGDSDNVVAEALARQVALARGEEASFPGAARAVADTLSELGALVDDVVIADGSGLSRDNQLTAHQLTEILLIAASPTHPALSGIFAGLPVAGWSGTLATRYRGTQQSSGPGAGVIRAKTGTLTDVHSIAGLVVTADGRLLGFAFLADDVPLSQDQARAALDDLAAALAGCGC